ncbi:2,3-bisphosphoglycerate-dependent phosphoglycerate mutase [Polaromonas sp. CG_9.5]|uniref:2,3-bisphosphoglycerate-dependent phosphoglycerate mutase n=1 Tax=Polaromonas sp. CG_9.5 TaxID=3071705 RepID=UPI002DF86880|nr:2,3-bisphosphoglycerate-dependent phosphoglycerate mutase [Polaromonas sp. CG_9.5]
MPQLILIRHGESEWNRDNRFTGWADVGLTERGRIDMQAAGALLRKEGLLIDLAFTSLLSRCIVSQWALLEGMQRVWVPTVLDWRLNERHYGALTGLSKTEAINTFGAQAVQQWRRSFLVPPPLGNGDGGNHAIVDARYNALKAEEIPQGESLAQVVERVRPLWETTIAASLRAGKRVAITGHGNSLRALMKLISHIADDDITQVEVPNAVPMIYDLDNSLEVIRAFRLGIEPTPPSEIL